MKKNLLLAGVIILIISSMVWLQSKKPPQIDVSQVPTLVATSTIETPPVISSQQAVAPKIPSKYLTSAQKAKQYEAGHELAGITGYLNLPAGQDAITLKSLIGKKVILVDFWTYSCINCQRTLPYLTDWYAKYKDQGLEIVGVHAPEFEFEKERANVQMAIEKYGITYPVVQDNNMATWAAYNNRYWPRHYLIDIDGYIADDHIGEGGYDITEKKIQELLAERADRLGVQANVNKVLSKPQIEAAPTYAVSPETYFGSSRNEYLGKLLTLPGSWSIEPEFARSTGEAQIGYTYQAQHVYFVASATKPITVEILRDGIPLTPAQAGEDVVIGSDGKSRATVNQARLYKLINELPGESTHILEIRVPSAGLNAFTFTFG